MTAAPPDAEAWQSGETATPRTARERRRDAAATGLYALGWEMLPLVVRLGGALRQASPDEQACVRIGNDAEDGHAWAALEVAGTTEDTDVIGMESFAFGECPSGLDCGPRGAVALLGAHLLEDARGHASVRVRRVASDVRRAMKGAQNP